MKFATGMWGFVALGLANSASAALIGPASDYNVFIFGSGSFMSTNTDTMETWPPAVTCR